MMGGVYTGCCHAVFGTDLEDLWWFTKEPTSSESVNIACVCTQHSLANQEIFSLFAMLTVSLFFDG